MAPDKTDTEWMEIALELAAQGEALASPNPLVGAVVVREDEEAGRAFHTYDGVKHAGRWRWSGRARRRAARRST
jgi:diaminohydroxyphosphoribosylaminopyrimidine deaminase/5-amino-6-(5-phosphoribosylamino)uracil reductase